MIHTVDNYIDRIDSTVLAVGILLMALNTISGVIGRFIFNYSLFFGEEVNSILIIFITFTGLSYAARHGRHIRMSAIYDTFSPKTRKILMIFITLFTAFIMLLLGYASILFIMKISKYGRLLPALQIPVHWTLVWLPIGFAITAIQYFLTAVKNMTHKDIYLSTKVLEGYDEKGSL